MKHKLGRSHHGGLLSQRWANRSFASRLRANGKGVGWESLSMLHLQSNKKTLNWFFILCTNHESSLSSSSPSLSSLSSLPSLSFSSSSSSSCSSSSSSSPSSPSSPTSPWSALSLKHPQTAKTLNIGLSSYHRDTSLPTSVIHNKTNMTNVSSFFFFLSFLPLSFFFSFLCFADDEDEAMSSTRFSRSWIGRLKPNALSSLLYHNSNTRKLTLCWKSCLNLTSFYKSHCILTMFLSFSVLPERRPNYIRQCCVTYCRSIAILCTDLIDTTNQDPTTTNCSSNANTMYKVKTWLDSTLPQTVWLTSLSLHARYPSSGCWKHRGSSHSTKSTACILWASKMCPTDRVHPMTIVMIVLDTSWHKNTLLSCCLPFFCCGTASRPS